MNMALHITVITFGREGEDGPILRIPNGVVGPSDGMAIVNDVALLDVPESTVPCPDDQPFISGPLSRADVDIRAHITKASELHPATRRSETNATDYFGVSSSSVRIQNHTRSAQSCSRPRQVRVAATHSLFEAGDSTVNDTPHESVIEVHLKNGRRDSSVND